ncbi:MAG: GNAT family N-acetyltransferase [Silicimonas sp.]|nr:GNAT family N-acetyltransferase [Silicimonas sp.]
MTPRFRPLTPDLWPAFETFFSGQSETNNCWCMWWRLPSAEIVARSRGPLRRAFRDRVTEGPPPGLLALDGETPVGWVQVTPRADVPRFNKARMSKPSDVTDADQVWAASCFFFAKSYRRSGLMTDLARAACDHAAQHGAAEVEAAALKPRDSLQRGDGFVGIVPALARAGFREIEERSAVRVLMRWTPG